MRNLMGMAVLLGCLAASSLMPGQQLNQRMNNKDVIQLVALGIGDDIVIEKIQTAAATDFDTSVEGLKALKAAKVSDAIIRVMLNPHATPIASTASAPPATAAAPMATGIPDDVGVYINLKGKITEVEPEIVGWQTGGKLKSMATMGLDKGHVNGKVMNPKSSLQVANPVEFIIKTPEGTSVTEYQLLRLDEHDNRREFRAMTGGVIHASGGAERNAVPFNSDKISGRVWRVKLDGLPKGEYGFLPPGLNSASLSSSGKIYSFGVTE
jgi:hypothetical protein